MSNRAEFATRLGAIAATVGSAVGLGNIWRFPYEAGQHGGGAFLLVYVVCVFVMGIPVIVSEFIIGRATHKNVVGALRQLAPGTRLHWVSYVGIVASLMILSFYSVVCGWVIEYLINAIGGGMSGHTPQEYSVMFSSFVANPYRCVMWTVLFLLLNYLVLRRGVKKGIEKFSNIVMPLLFVILIVFCVNSLTLPQVQKGLKFLFCPDFSQLTPKVAIGAMGQAFFSLSLGLSCLLTYASYFNNKEHLVRSATIVALLDTLVAILAGVVIFPAVFSYGLQPGTGPKLVFEILPNIFQQMVGGYIWSILFFLLLFFASITSTISMSEISIAFFCEEHHMSRGNATLLNTVIAIIFGTLCALSFGVMGDFKIFGKTLFDLFDYVSSNILLPVGGVFFSLFVGWYIDRRIVNDQLTNKGTVNVVTARPLLVCIRFIAPAAIVLVFLYGLGLFNIF
jgi:NSS family neurotransmitter:Na+ symporter